MNGAMITSNGILKDPETGRFLPGSKPTTAITKETSLALHRMRKEKTQAAVRASLAKAANTRNSIQAIALGAEVLYQDVFNPELDLDKRRKTWLTVGQQADLLTSRYDSDPTNGGQNMIIPVSLVDRLLAVRNGDNSHGNE